MSAPARVGNVVTQLRELSGLSQTDLARKAGISPGMVGKCERLERSPGEKTIRALAKAFDVSVAVLFGELPIPAHYLNRQLTEIQKRIVELQQEEERIRKSIANQ